MKLWYAAAGVAAVSGGMLLFRRRKAGSMPSIKTAVMIVRGALLGGSVIAGLAARLAKKTAQLQMCRVRSAWTRRGGISGIAGGLRVKAGEAFAAGEHEAGAPVKA